MIRATVRDVMKLPGSLPKAYYYANKAGLGLMQLRSSVPSMVVARFNRMVDSKSPLVVAATDSAAYKNRLAKARQSLIVHDGELMDSSPKIEKYHQDLLFGMVDGKDLVEVNKVPGVHSWMTDGSKMMTGQTYIESVKLRANALPTRSRMARGRDRPRNCRAGCLRQETLHHVLQVCERTHGARVKRHNAVASGLGNFLKDSGHRVMFEPRIKHGDTHLKPDIICIKEGIASVIDVQISGAHPLDSYHEKKVAYYKNDTVEAYALSQGATQVKYGALIISYKGLVSPRSFRFLKDLGVSTGKIKVLVVRALELSTYIWHVFNRSTAISWNRRVCRKGERAQGRAFGAE